MSAKNNKSHKGHGDSRNPGMASRLMDISKFIYNMGKAGLSSTSTYIRSRRKAEILRRLERAEELIAANWKETDVVREHIGLKKIKPKVKKRDFWSDSKQKLWS